jgi:signal transduction histidine kinase
MWRPGGNDDVPVLDDERLLVGLGLAIVKSITEAHDGTLTLAPRDAGGLRVTVQLPAAAPRTGR